MSEAAREPATSASPTPHGNAAAASAEHGVAVVELFTSEGCSSCPPADAALAGLAARAKAQALPVFPLSFHVDYWDSLGWRDRFSDPRYSERQRAYGRISAGQTYTPQAVVNGRAETVGSDAARIDALVDAALARTSPERITLSARRDTLGLEVSYRVEGVEAKGRVLNLALVEPRAQSHVERGENAGEHWAHVNVVRAFSTRPLSGASAGRWAVPAQPELAGHALGVVAYVQAPAQGEVFAASALEIP